jgi:phage-related minor tail protein
MQGDYAELVFEVKNINKTIRDIVKVRKEIEKTGKETKSLQDTLVSGWSFGKVFQAMQKFGDAFRDVQVTMKSFSSIYGTFNAQADEGVKMLIKDFQETERSAKKLLQ